jgi:hypothetical protein
MQRESLVVNSTFEYITERSFLRGFPARKLKTSNLPLYSGLSAKHEIYFSMLMPKESPRKNLHGWDLLKFDHPFSIYGM